jgi:Mad3/BUB1 homology region 1/Protein kinase domain
MSAYVPAQPDDQPAWEQSKENVAPLARGRDKASLHTALHATASEIASARAAHEDSMRRAVDGVGPHAGDPLVPAASYVKWAADAYAPRAPQLLAALELACLAFVDQPRYASDPRFVRLWVRYADARDDPLDCFRYMRTHHIGETSALFYEAWATTLEYKKNFPAADDAYKLGMDRDAQPAARLEQRQREFLNRMVARDRRAEARATKAATAGGGNKGRQPAVASHTASNESNRDNVILDENNVSIANSEYVRPALGGLSLRQAASSRRPVVSNDVDVNARHAASFSTSSSSRRRDRSAPASNMDTSFKVFTDLADDKGDDFGVEAVAEALPFPYLAKADDLRKENEGTLPSQWAGVTLPQCSTMSRSRQRSRGSRKPVPVFEIYSDPVAGQGELRIEDNASGGTRSVDMEAEEARQSQQFEQQKQNELRCRQRHDDEMHQQDDRREEDNARTRRATNETISGPPSPTINTRVAMQQVEDMFNSPMPQFEREGDDMCPPSSRPQHDAQPSTRQPFRIYRDENADDDVTGKENDADRHCNETARTLDDPVAEANVLRSLPELESGHDPQYETVEYDMLPQREDLAQKQNVGEHPELPELDIKEEVLKWCADTIPYMPGFLFMNNSGVDMTEGNVVTLDGGGEESRTYLIEGKLGDGSCNKSHVYAAALVDDLMGMGGDDEDEEGSLAIKVSGHETLAWEFYMYRVMQSRFESGWTAAVPNVLYFYDGAPLSYLVFDRVNIASLAQVLDMSSNNCVAEPVAAFFTVELLKAVEAVHGVGVLHADITLENIMLRKDNGAKWSGPYTASGDNGWSSVGISLVDFNHAVDTYHSAVGGRTAADIMRHTAFLGSRHMDAAYVHQPEGAAGPEPYSFNADCYSIGCCAKRLLGANRSGSSNAAVWQSVFEQLSSVSVEALSEDAVDVLRLCRYALEDILTKERSGGAALRAELKKVFIAASEARQAGDITRG